MKGYTFDTEKMRSINDMLEHTIEELTKTGEGRVKTGFSDLDRALGGGLRGGELICVAARPGMGKTSFVLKLAMEAAKSRKVYIFSMDRSAEWLTMLMLSNTALVEPMKLFRDRDLLSDSEWQRLTEASAELCDRDISICDAMIENADDIEKMLDGAGDAGLIVVDMPGSPEGVDTESRDRYYDILRAFKVLSKRMSIPVVFTTQISRSAEKRKDCRPLPKDIPLEISVHYSDVVLFLYREAYYDRLASEDTAEVIVAKNRYGERCTVQVGWNGRYAKFYDLENEQEDD